MAWDVAWVQDQVQTLTGHEGLNDRVLGWVNRVNMDITRKAYWTKQVLQTGIDSRGATTTDIDDLWVDGDDVGQLNPISVHRVDYTDKNTILRKSMRDLYCMFNGLAINYTASTEVSHYAIPQWADAGSGASSYMKPQFVMFPAGAATGTDIYQVYFLAAPDKFTAATDYNWYLTKYPHTVLAGVLRMAFIFLGDFNKYGEWKRHYMNGIHQMLMSEETSVASTPTLRSVYPGILTRGAE